MSLRTLTGRVSPPQVNAQVSVGQGLLVELLVTFQLVFTVFATCDPKRSDLGGSAGLAIGFAVAVGHFFAVSSPQRPIKAPPPRQG